jgi:hypothetical protein
MLNTFLTKSVKHDESLSGCNSVRGCLFVCKTPGSDRVSSVFSSGRASGGGRRYEESGKIFLYSEKKNLDHALQRSFFADAKQGALHSH